MLESGLIKHSSHKQWHAVETQARALPIDPVSISDVATLFMYVYFVGLAIATVTLIVECILHHTQKPTELEEVSSPAVEQHSRVSYSSEFE
jgi:hypothetical protein